MLDCRWISLVVAAEATVRIVVLSYENPFTETFKKDEHN